jgi:hypothetical protein
MTTTRRRVVDAAIANYDTPVVGRCLSATRVVRCPSAWCLAYGITDTDDTRTRCQQSTQTAHSAYRGTVQISFAIIVGMWHC